MTQEELSLSKIKVRNIRNLEGVDTKTKIFVQPPYNDLQYVEAAYKEIKNLTPRHIRQWEAINQVSHKAMLKVLREEMVFLKVQL